MESLVPQGMEAPWKAAGQAAGIVALSEPPGDGSRAALACIPQQRYRSASVSIAERGLLQGLSAGFEPRGMENLNCLKWGIDRAALQTFCFDLFSSSPFRIQQGVSILPVQQQPQRESGGPPGPAGQEWPKAPLQMTQTETFMQLMLLNL